MKNLSIIGGGLVGSLLSIFLSKNGFNVDVFEKRSDPRTSIGEKGRSINLALSDRGWRSLNRADKRLEEMVRDNSIPMRGRIIHDEKGNQSLQPYGKEGQYIYSISRSLLNELLINFAEKEYNVNYRFNERCVEVDLQSDKIVFEHAVNRAKSVVDSEIVFGADGAFSQLRYEMQKTERFNYSQSFLEYGYKELTIPSKDGQHILDKNALHIWPRKSFMLIALPNIDGSFTCTLFLPYEGMESFSCLNTREQVGQFFASHFQDIVSLIPDLWGQFASNPIGSLVTINCFPWTYKSRYALIGDAAHGIVPFYGQGMNAGFEDCTILDNILKSDKGDWEMIFKKFQSQRKKNTDAIAELALRNFVEMRDLVIDDRFILRKKIEAKMNTLFPKDWIPLYTMVTFSEIDYSKALSLAKIQDDIMDEVLDISGIETSWENLDFEAVMTKYKLAQKSI